MDRRSFLKSLVAFGVSSAFPGSLTEAAIEADVSSAWAGATAHPFAFYVEECGALSTLAAEHYPSSRIELFGVEPLVTRRDLSIFFDDYAGAQWIAESAHATEIEEREGDDPWDGDWGRFLDDADESTIDRLIREANDWLESTPDGEDYENANIRGWSGRGQALSYFRDAFEFCDDFDIAVVEGDCPGSSYFAAELRMSIEAANALATEKGLPIRFAAQP